MTDAEVTAVCNQKGGVGKTTLTVNIAAAMARALPPTEPAGVDLKNLPDDLTEREKVLDQFASQVLAVSTDPQRSLIDWLDRVALSCLRAGKPMPIDYAQEHRNPRVLAKLKTARRYKRIYVDCPGWLSQSPDGAAVDAQASPSEKEILEATLESADLAVVPLEPEDLAFAPTKRTIDEVIKPSGVPFIVVINNWDPRDGTGDLNDTRARVKRQGWPLAETVIRRYKLHTSAPASGRLITQYPSNRVAVEARSDFLSLSLELTAGGGR